MSAPTDPQLAYVSALRRKLRLTTPMLDSQCMKRFGVGYAALDRAQVSQLIDELAGWVAVPADLLRAHGQLDLFADGGV